MSFSIPGFRLCHLAAIGFSTAGFAGCNTAADHRAAVRDDTRDRITVGTVQKDLRLGMSGADILAALGSPNIVTTDDQRNEVWTYDKMATEVVSSSGGLSLLPIVFGATGGWLGGLASGGTYEASATSRTQRTLTIIIKFDGQKRVRDFAYHASSF